MRRNTFRKSRSPSRKDGSPYNDNITITSNPCFSDFNDECNNNVFNLSTGEAADIVKSFQDQQKDDYLITLAIKIANDNNLPLDVTVIKSIVNDLKTNSTYALKIVNKILSNSSHLETTLPTDVKSLMKLSKSCDFQDEDNQPDDIEFPTYLYDDSEDKDLYISGQIQNILNNSKCNIKPGDLDEINSNRIKKILNILNTTPGLNKYFKTDGSLDKNEFQKDIQSLENSFGVREEYLLHFVDYYNKKLGTVNNIFDFYPVFDASKMLPEERNALEDTFVISNPSIIKIISKLNTKLNDTYNLGLLNDGDDLADYMGIDLNNLQKFVKDDANNYVIFLATKGISIPKEFINSRIVDIVGLFKTVKNAKKIADAARAKKAKKEADEAKAKAKAKKEEDKAKAKKEADEAKAKAKKEADEAKAATIPKVFTSENEYLEFVLKEVLPIYNEIERTYTVGELKAFNGGLLKEIIDLCGIAKTNNEEYIKKQIEDNKTKIQDIIIKVCDCNQYLSKMESFLDSYSPDSYETAAEGFKTGYNEDFKNSKPSCKPDISNFDCFDTILLNAYTFLYTLSYLKAKNEGIVPATKDKLKEGYKDILKFLSEKYTGLIGSIFINNKGFNKNDKMIVFIYYLFYNMYYLKTLSTGEIDEFKNYCKNEGGEYINIVPVYLIDDQTEEEIKKEESDHYYKWYSNKIPNTLIPLLYILNIGDSNDINIKNKYSYFACLFLKNDQNRLYTGYENEVVTTALENITNKTIITTPLFNIT